MRALSLVLGLATGGLVAWATAAAAQFPQSVDAVVTEAGRSPMPDPTLALAIEQVRAARAGAGARLVVESSNGTRYLKLPLNVL